MSRKVTPVIAVLVGTGLVVGSLFLASRPTWVTATQAEVDRVLGEPLSRPDVPSPDELQRAADLDRALERLDFAIAGNTKSPNVSNEWLARNAAQVASLRPILEAGGYGVASGAYDNQAPYSGLNGRIRSTILRLADTAKNGTQGPKAIAIVTGQLLARRQLEAGRSISELLISVANQTAVDDAAVSSAEAGQLDLAAARDVLQSMRGGASDSTLLKRALIREFQSTVYPVIADPLSYFLRTTARLGKPGEQDADLPGNYDALATASEIRALYDEAIRDVDLPYDRIESAVETRVRKIQGALPADRTGSLTGVSKEWEKIVFRVKMARIPNSFAYLTLIFPIEMPIVLEGYRRYRVIHALATVEMASYVFRLRHGRVPAKLEELKTAGLIDSIPADPFSHSALRFDPSKRKVWSVGPDHADDGGSGPLFSTSGRDIAARLP